LLDKPITLAASRILINRNSSARRRLSMNMIFEVRARVIDSLGKAFWEPTRRVRYFRSEVSTYVAPSLADWIQISSPAVAVKESEPPCAKASSDEQVTV